MTFQVKETQEYNAGKPKSVRKPISAIVLEVLFVASLVIVIPDVIKENSVQGLIRLLATPVVLFLIRIVVGRSDIGASFAAIIAFVNESHLNGLPLVSLFLLFGALIITTISSDKVWGEVLKVAVGVSAGSYIQARIDKN